MQILLTRWLVRSLRKLGKVKPFESMRVVLEEMKLASCEISGESYAIFDLDDDILGVVELMQNGFRVKPDSSRVEEALNLLQEMANDGFHLDQFTNNTLVNGLCRTGHVKHALEVMDAMLQEGFDVNIFVYISLISGLVKLRSVEFRDQMVSSAPKYSHITL
ncbi:hypothetical protein FNV43_RR04658 [Rhamnella rubrinervis]|uniref:Pentatricopeptide repeat-containing protein n=1 Tax=Rhamnella rubrinervis TaxID=2594499 RepID=A0A8K0HKM3_9ROSA|nr:hypothetical protein FNV43_RR04658 [Rhamnella rubrinervis]